MGGVKTAYASIRIAVSGERPSRPENGDGLPDAHRWVSGCLAPVLASPIVKRVPLDLGYAIAALCAGLIADAFGMQWAIVAIGLLTFASGAVVALTMKRS